MGLETCIDQQDLKAFALGHLDEDRSDAIAAHLSACARCEETMAGFDDTDDSMLAAVREAAGEAVAEPPSTPAEAVLQQIANPWRDAEHAEKHASTGEWIRDYELLEPLGHGGMGTVYKAVHARLQRPVAIKLLPSRRLRDPDAVGRFEREMKAIGRLDHPAIVRATDAGDADGTHFLVMDYVYGIDLSHLIKLTGPMDVANACEVIRQAAIGLQYAHDQGLIHRDVKPSNLMMEIAPRDGRSGSTRDNAATVKVLDLGLALFGAASEAVDELTTVGQLMGTLDYMAPEQADDSHDVDARADVYSLGATMFKLLTGTAPYESSDRRTPLQKMKALATVDAPSVKTRQPALPDDVVAIVDRMLLRDPALRFQTAAEVAQAVAPFCGGHHLAELTQQAMEQRSHHAPRDEPLSGPVESKKPASHQTEAAVAGMPDAVAVIKDVPMAARETSAAWPPRRLITRSVMATLGVLLVVAAGILIRIKTDTGTLIIECASSDVPVEIRQGKDTVKQLTLLAGENKVTLRSGSYELVLPAEYDSLTLDAGKFGLSRGGEWIARISERADSLPVAIAADNPAETVKTDDLMPSQSANFNGPSVTPDVAQIILDPIRQVEFQRLRDRYAELLRKNDALQDSLDAQRATLGFDHPRVRSFQDSMDLAHRESARVRAQMQEMLEIEQKIEEERANSAAKRAADLFNPAGTDTAQPLYAGKTFDQWLQVAQTERSTEELAKAIDAIGILGHGEQDPEAADAILKVIDRSKYVDPQLQTDDQGKLILTAIRAIRSLNADEIINTIVEGFKDREPSVHEFVLDGLLQRPDIVTHGGGSNLVVGRTSLGSREPLASMLQASEPFAVQLIELSDMNSGTLRLEMYSVILGNWAASDPVFNYIQSHVGSSRPSSAVESYLRKFTVDPETVPADERLPYTAVPAAKMLARHAPEDLFARIFVRAIQDNVRTGGTSQSVYVGPPPSQLSQQMNAWHGLSELGSHAQSALPFMLETIRHAADDDSIYNAAALVYWSRSENPEYLYTANMRLFAIEFTAMTETKNPAALDCLRAEFTRTIGQAPTDGAFEFTPGRQELLLRCDEVLSYGLSSFGGKEPPKISPIDIELTNSCILAWKAISGSNPRFASASLGDLTTRERVAGVTIANMPTFVSHSSDEK